MGRTSVQRYRGGSHRVRRPYAMPITPPRYLDFLRDGIASYMSASPQLPFGQGPIYGSPYVRTPKRKLSFSSQTKTQPTKKVNMSKTKNSNTGRYYTVGRYGGKIRKAKIQKINKYNKLGVTCVYENGGVTECPDIGCQYIGHAISWDKTLLNICFAIVKKLLVLSGNYVVNNQLSYLGIDSAENFGITWSFTSEDISGSARAGFLITATDTLNSIGIKLRDDFVARFNDSLKYQITEIQFGKTDGDTSVPTMIDPRSKLNGDSIEIDFECYSKLMVQNRTRASTGIGNDDPDVDTTENITNNPLHGKVYRSNKKWLNGFTLNTQFGYGTVGTTYEVDSLIANKYTGLINANSETGFGSVPYEIYRKPPPSWVFGVKKANNIILLPGDIKYSNWKFNFKMKLTTLLQKFPHEVASIENTEVTPIGFAEMMAFEKQLSSREANLNISLGFELTQTYRTFVTIKSSTRTIPLNSIGSGQIS